MTAPTLTAREQDIARLVAKGLSNKEIARALCITPGTVKLHLHNIYVKMTLRNRAQLATWHHKG